jgi:hypothetical protein
MQMAIPEMRLRAVPSMTRSSRNSELASNTRP